MTITSNEIEVIEALDFKPEFTCRWRQQRGISIGGIHIPVGEMNECENKADWLVRFYHPLPCGTCLPDVPICDQCWTDIQEVGMIGCPCVNERVGEGHPLSAVVQSVEPL